MDSLTSKEYPDVRGLMGTYIVKPNRARDTQCDTAASRLLRPRMKLGLVPTLSRLQIDVMRSLDKHEWMVLIFLLGDPK